METIKCTKCATENRENSRYCNGCGYELSKPGSETAKTQTLPEPNVKNRSAKTIIGIAVVALFSLFFYVAMQQLLPMVSIDADMTKIASEVNKDCPIMVDAVTRLDNTMGHPGRIFQYNYTLIYAEQSEIDTVIFKSQLEPGIINNLKTNPEFGFQRANGITMKFLYKDKDGLYICCITITPEQYQ